MALYTTFGQVRGCCGHAHKTVEAAEKCRAEDHRGCKAQGGYSDRHVREIESRRELETYSLPQGPGRDTDE